MSERVVIVGAGLAGLCCARELHRAGLPFVVLDAADAVGGRVRTDAVEGFRLDRGFQVLQTAYPEARRELDYGALELAAFEPGALVRTGGRFAKIVDPWRRPLAGLASAFAPVGTFGDKLKVARLRRRAVAGSVDELLARPQTTTRAHLDAAGISAEMVDAFFRPFYGGVFLERELRTSSRMFEFTFRMFATGDAALPARGMQAIPEQLAAALPDGAVRLGARVVAIDRDGATLADGSRVAARAVVVAVDGGAAHRLCGDRVGEVRAKAVTTLHFAADASPLRERFLVLNGDDDGPINDLCVPSDVQPGYAPPGAALVSVSVVEPRWQAETGLEAAVRAQLRQWFGAGVDGWRTLRSLRIDHALPELRGDTDAPVARGARIDDATWICGDHRDLPSIQGAMASGRRAAEAVVTALR